MWACNGTLGVLSMTLIYQSHIIWWVVTSLGKCMMTWTPVAAWRLPVAAVLHHGPASLTGSLTRSLLCVCVRMNWDHMFLHVLLVDELFPTHVTPELPDMRVLHHVTFQIPARWESLIAHGTLVAVNPPMLGLVGLQSHIRAQHLVAGGALVSVWCRSARCPVQCVSIWCVRSCLHTKGQKTQCWSVTPLSSHGHSYIYIRTSSMLLGIFRLSFHC